MRQFYLSYPIFQTVSGKLNWSHYCELLSISDKEKRSFYEKEAVNAGWSVREMKRQIDSSLFERLLLSRGDANKEQVLALAEKGVDYAKPEDIIKDPYVFEILGLPEEKSFLESDLEAALVRQIEDFLLELGRGFMFVGTQQRVTVNNTHYYVDMVFYNKILHAYVLIELKTTKLTPEAAGQINMYLNYYAAEVNDPEDNPPIGIILLYFIAGKVRKSNKVTVPEIMGARYGQSASIISAVCVMLAYVGVLATQLKAAADIIVLLCASSGIEISHGLALTICTALIAIITVGGGLVSVAYSDAISALLMIGGFFLAIPFLIGVANSQGATLPPEKMTITGGMSGWELLGYFLPSLALMLGDQNMLQRFASAKNSDEAKKSNIGMFIGEILVIISIVLVVTQAAKLYPTLDVPSNVIFQVAVDYLPLAFGALVMCACMAFIVTTADSYLLSSATNLTNDIYVKYIRKDATDKQKMLVLRGTIVVFSVIAVALTLYFPTVLSLQMTAYTMYGAAITPAILFALFSKKVTPAAGIAGILVGGLATIVWTLMGTPYGIQCAIVAVPASVIAILVVSAVTPKGEAARSLDALYQEK